MKRRRTKRKVASRKKLSRVQVAAIDPNRHPNYRIALPPARRRLSFGDRWDYAPAPEAHSHIEIKPRYELFIGGKFVKPRSGKYFDSINPATEETLAKIADANARDVDLAVKAARRAYENVWGKMSGRERGKYLYRIARLIQEKSRELAVLESMDGGKTIKESRDVDLPLVAAHFFIIAVGCTRLSTGSRAGIRGPFGAA